MTPRAPIVATGDPQNPESEVVLVDRWEVEMFVDQRGFCPMVKWMESLEPAKAAAVDAAVLMFLRRGGISLAGTPWMKPLGEGLFEFRIRHSVQQIRRLAGADQPEANESATRGVLLRIFLTFHGERICLLIAGYDKGRDPSRRRQQREIARARRYLTEWRLGNERE